MNLHAGDRVVRGACPHDCPDTCAFLYDVKNGKLVDVTGDPDHPMTRGDSASSLTALQSITTTPTGCSTRCGAPAPKAAVCSSAFRGAMLLRKSKAGGRTSSRPTARKRSCPTSILGIRGRSTGSRRRRVLQSPGSTGSGKDLLRVRVFDGLDHDRRPRPAGWTWRASPTRSTSSCGG